MSLPLMRLLLRDQMCTFLLLINFPPFLSEVAACTLIDFLAASKLPVFGPNPVDVFLLCGKFLLLLPSPFSRLFWTFFSLSADLFSHGRVLIDAQHLCHLIVPSACLTPPVDYVPAHYDFPPRSHLHTFLSPVWREILPGMTSPFPCVIARPSYSCPPTRRYSRAFFLERKLNPLKDGPFFPSVGGWFPHR